MEMTKTMQFKKLLTLFSLSALIASMSFALHEDRPPGAKFQMEQSSETVAQQQAYQGRIDAAGGVPIREGEQRANKPATSKDAASMLSNVARKKTAAKNLEVADKRIGAKPTSSGKPWWFALLLVGFGVVGFVGIKDWFGKNIPAMPVQKKRKRGPGDF